MDLLKVSNEAFYILLFIAPGYIGMQIYFIDRQWNALNAIHLFYGSLMFSTVSYAVYFGAIDRFVPKETWVFVSINLLISFLLGILWKGAGHKLLHSLLKFLRITSEDNEYSPWTIVFNNSKIFPSQIIVHLKSGRVLQLDDTVFYHRDDLRKAGVFPYYVSPDGDLLMVVTQKKEKEDADWEDASCVVENAPWGVKLSYVPQREINYVEVRVCPKKMVNSLALLAAQRGQSVASDSMEHSA
ncbi:hypothetical protein [Azospirillum argentinense]|uniref:Uncharacterized protein n=1 Tax=Azospirillum argentinense TaxID=2970906 RepID=A0ABW8VHG1_9PROT